MHYFILMYTVITSHNAHNLQYWVIMFLLLNAFICLLISLNFYINHIHLILSVQYKLLFSAKTNMLCLKLLAFLFCIRFKIRTCVCKKNVFYPVCFNRWMIQRPRIEVFKCCIWIVAQLNLFHHKLFM